MSNPLPSPADVLGFYEETDVPVEEDEDSDSDSDDDPSVSDDPETSKEPPETVSQEVETFQLPDFKNKTITICGSGSSLAQLFTENEYGMDHGDELWAVDNVAKLVKYDRLFFMEHPKKFKKCDWLKDASGVVYVCEQSPEIPTGTLYPIEEVVNTLGLLYISSSGAYALALAICCKASKVRLFGLDFDSEPVKRGCIEFLICKAVHTGINIEIPSTSSILGNNLSIHKRLYGFEHCDDPLILGTKAGKRCLMRASEIPDQQVIAS